VARDLRKLRGHFLSGRRRRSSRAVEFAAGNPQREWTGRGCVGSVRLVSGTFFFGFLFSCPRVLSCAQFSPAA
jgi:hypothetical protein